MSRVRSASGDFARRGFDSPGTAATVWERWSERSGGETGLALEALEPAANRDQALEALARIAEEAPEVWHDLRADPGWLRRVVLVAGASDLLARFLARHPAEVRGLQQLPEQGRGAAGWTEFFRERFPRDDQGVALADADVLRVAYHRAICEIAARDLGSTDPVEIVHRTGAELSDVADAVLDSALAIARSEVPGWESVRLAVVAMGKTGARELNYVSDVDVIHVAEPAEGATTDEAMLVGTRLAGALARICSAHTAEGTIWPIDAALRPEGKAGPLVRTVESCRAYYTKWAANWEFQALLKARPAAGDLSLGQEFCDMVAPLVWEAGQREGFLPQVRAMRQRVISLIPPKQTDRDIKLSSGGLRDTEFSAQLLQLVHGRGDERIRVRDFEAGLANTIEWYREHEDWWRPAKAATEAAYAAKGQ